MSPITGPGAVAALPEWLAYIESLHAKSIDLGLDRVRQVAQRLGLSLPAVKIVVGGTNGKGSTCAMLEAIYLAAGFKVGLYTSPHLIDFNERVRINGELASDAMLVAQFQAVELARGDVTLTYFEFTTLAALQLLAQARLDVVVLEIGLGGRLDAVNIVDADCAILTNVDIDHVEWLGNTREAIGAEKAHIYRPGRPAIYGDSVPPPRSLLDYVAAIGADLWRFGHDYTYFGDQFQWSYVGRHQRRHALLPPALRGANQRLNAAAALAAIEALQHRLPVTQQAVRLGLMQATLIGRFQVLPGRPTIILDVAHSPHAADALAQNLDNMGFYSVTYGVFGMLMDKDIAGVVKCLGPRIQLWLCTGLPGPRGIAGEALAARVQQALPSPDPANEVAKVSAYADPVHAYAAARRQARENDRIVVFGSFLTVAAVYANLEKKNGVKPD
jgi:dihydrofolate synthase/folylpolyglutamate synthase